VPLLWESAIKVLQGLPHSRLQGRRSHAGTNTGPVPQLAEAHYHIHRAHKGQVLPEATWKKLIRDKVRTKYAVAAEPVCYGPGLTRLRQQCKGHVNMHSLEG